MFIISSHKTRQFPLVDELIVSMAHMETLEDPTKDLVTLTFSMHAAGAPFCLSVARLISVKIVPFTTPGVLGTIFDSLIKFFWGKRFALKPWGQGD